MTPGITDVIQKINILIMNQCVTDLCGSFFALLTALVEVDGTRMSRDSIYDQFVCRVWLTRVTLWSTMTVSTYGILLTALERYVAVIYPFWYKVLLLLLPVSYTHLTLPTNREV